VAVAFFSDKEVPTTGLIIFRRGDVPPKLEHHAEKHVLSLSKGGNQFSA
jgi:hypothetical protein